MHPKTPKKQKNHEKTVFLDGSPPSPIKKKVSNPRFVFPPVSYFFFYYIESKSNFPPEAAHAMVIKILTEKLMSGKLKDGNYAGHDYFFILNKVLNAEPQDQQGLACYVCT